MPTSSDTHELLDRLIGLSGDEPADPEFERPGQLLLSLWRVDRESCRKLIRASIQWWERMPRMADEVEFTALELRDPEFWTLLKECADLPAMPAERRLSLASLELRHGDDSAADFTKRFRSLTRKIERGTLNPDKVDFHTYFMDICRRRLSHLTPELQGLKHRYETSSTFLFHSDAKAYLDAALLWFGDGVASLLTVARSPKASVASRAACIYCLGCAADPALAQDLISIYHGATGRAGYDVRMACVESIVYSADLSVAESFVADSLQAHFSSRSLDRQSYDADIGLLLIAAYNLPRLSQRLQDATASWLQARNEDLRAYALVALERHGLTDEGVRSSLGRKYVTVRQIAEANPSPLMLMPFRSASRE